MDALTVAIIQQYGGWVFWVAGGFAVLNFLKWASALLGWFFGVILKYVGFETKGMRKRRESEERLKKTEEDIKEIKANSDRNVEMFLKHEEAVVEKFTGIKDEIVKELNTLKEEMAATNEASMKTDRAMLRDRIASGMRYFNNQRMEADGKVHVSLSEYENMNALFQEYFAKHGNGTFRKIYEEEFKHFCIDQ